MAERKQKPLSLKRSRGDQENDTDDGMDSRKSSKVEERYSFDATLEDITKFKEGENPVNTEKNTEWAVQNFEAWRSARNKKFEEKCLSTILSSTDMKELCDWLCKCIAETRKSDGTEYTPRSLYLLLAGLQRHIRKLNPSKELSILHDVEFKPLKNVCDSVFKRLHAKGIGTKTKATEVITQKEKDTLWELGVINLDTPIGLLYAVFFYNGKNFCLRGEAEHKNLKLSQVKRQVTNVGGKMISSYVYEEFRSKNNQGGFASLNHKKKRL